MGLTTDLAKSLYNIQCLGLSDKEQLHVLVADFFAAAYAGARLNSTFNKAVERVVLDRNGIEESTVLFQKRKYSIRQAAFMNSVYGHGAELDDGSKTAAGHVGVHIIPSVFSLAEKLGNKNDEVLVALTTGYEAFVRISSAVQPGIIQRGFHSTGMTGTLACAAACAKLYHLDAQGIENAIGLATTMTGGLLSYGDSRPYIKPLNPGKAAENGVFAAMLANEGIQGPTEALEGPNGWFHAVTDSVDVAYLEASDHFLLHDCYIKLYPSCRHTHCGIDAAIQLHKRININEIEKVNVYIYPNAIKLAGIKTPKNQDETKFSIPYTLARALLTGKYGIADMNPQKQTEEEKKLVEKINLIADPLMENRSQKIRGTRVELVKKNGDIDEQTVLVPKGDPENPLTKDDVVEKLRICSTGMEEAAVIMEILTAIESIDGSSRFVNPMRLTGAMN